MEEVEVPHVISIEDGFARFTPTGFATHLSFVGLLEVAMIECQKHGQSRLLVDTRGLEHSPLSGVDRYELSEAAAEIWDRSISLAMIARDDQVDPDEFGRKVAENRGLFFRTFADEASARAWLNRPRPTIGDEQDAGNHSP